MRAETKLIIVCGLIQIGAIVAFIVFSTVIYAVIFKGDGILAGVSAPSWFKIIAYLGFPSLLIPIALCGYLLRKSNNHTFSKRDAIVMTCITTGIVIYAMFGTYQSYYVIAGEGPKLAEESDN